MRKSWRLPGISESYHVARRFDATAEERAKGNPQLSSVNMDRWVADPASQRALLEMYESVTGRAASVAGRLRGSDIHRYVKPYLLEAFRRGDFVFLRIPHVTITSVKEEKKASQPVEEEQQPAPEPKKKKSWVQIELVDQDGEHVPNVRYQLELPDGKKKAGTLDADGKAFVAGVEPGTCKISFPDFDASEWEAA